MPIGIILVAIIISHILQIIAMLMVMHGNSYSNNRGSPSELEVMLKDFISKQTVFNKSIEEKFDKIDALASKVDSLVLDVDILKSKVMSHDTEEVKLLLMQMPFKLELMTT